MVKGQRKIMIVADDPNAEPRGGAPGARTLRAGVQYSIPRGVHVNVQEGDRVRAGDPLMDGPNNPHDILHVLGRRNCRSTWSTKSRRSTASTPRRAVRAAGTPAAGREHQRGASDKHIEDSSGSLDTIE